MSVVGTIEEIKQAITECLRDIYPRGQTKGGISVTCFKNKMGADGQHLIGFGDGAKLSNALDELIKEGTIVSNNDRGEPVYHYMSNSQPPVVGHLEEIKLAIMECLCRKYPNELVRLGIELKCFKDKYGRPLKSANGLSLVGLDDGANIQKALDALVAEKGIIVQEKLRDGESIKHYSARTGSVPTIRTPENVITTNQRISPGPGKDNNALPEIGSTSHDMDLSIPKQEDMYNEFKETFCVPIQGGSSKAVKMEVAKAVAALANAGGGRLFIGVRDDGTAAGLKSDLQQCKNTDKLELAIRNFLDSKLSSLVDVEFRFMEEDYVVILVPKQDTGNWIYTKEDEFYVRRGNQSQKLTSKQTAEYQRSHG